MSITSLSRFVILLLGFCLAALSPARADFEVRGPDGKRILLKDNGTWRYLDAKDPPASAPPAVKEQAELQLLQRVDLPGGCSFSLVLSNRLPYEILSLVPDFVILRANGVMYTSQRLGFGPVKPGDAFRRDLRVLGIGCQDIARLQVRGGDRCDMGDLSKFSEPDGQCLARLRVVPSEVLTFDK